MIRSKPFVSFYLNLDLPSVTKDNLILIIDSKTSFRCDDRLENMNFEGIRENKRRDLEKNLKALRSEKSSLKKMLKDLESEINDINLDLEVLFNYSNYYKQYNDKKKKSSDTLFSNFSISSINAPSLRKSISDKENFERITKKLQKLEDFREIEKKKKMAELQEKDLLKLRIFNQIEGIQMKINKLKEELSLISNELIMHYHKVLSLGKDTR
jgi:hypothetical protein